MKQKVVRRKSGYQIKSSDSKETHAGHSHVLACLQEEEVACPCLWFLEARMSKARAPGLDSTAASDILVFAALMLMGPKGSLPPSWVSRFQRGPKER
jgi:hypothetical protein